MNKVEFLYLSQKDVIECGALDMGMVISELEVVFKLHYQGKTIMPDKMVLRWGDMDSEAINGRINAMAGYISDPINVAGIKWIASKPQNPMKYGMPRASALIILNDPEKGFPIAVMDGTVISAMRTGGVTGVAAKRLARKDSRVLCLIGAGTQNRTQLMAVKTALPSIDTVKVYDLNYDRAKRFAQEASEKFNIDLFAVTSPEEAVRDSDVIVTATTATSPIVKLAWVKEGAFISNVGNYEVESEVLKKVSKIIVDDWEKVKHRGVQTSAILFKEGKLSDEDIYANLGAIVAGSVAGRENQEEIIFFNPVGMAIEDLIVANKIYNTARIRNLGVSLLLWEQPYWV